jgi:hypothetical protein
MRFFVVTVASGKPMKIYTKPRESNLSGGKSSCQKN